MMGLRRWLVVLIAVLSLLGHEIVMASPLHAVMPAGEIHAGGHLHQGPDSTAPAAALPSPARHAPADARLDPRAHRQHCASGEARLSDPGLWAARPALSAALTPLAIQPAALAPREAFRTGLALDPGARRALLQVYRI
jgi:hypothetical protein